MYNLSSQISEVDTRHDWCTVRPMDDQNTVRHREGSPNPELSKLRDFKLQVASIKEVKAKSNGKGVSKIIQKVAKRIEALMTKLVKRAQTAPASNH